MKKESNYDRVTVIGVLCSVVALVLIWIYKPGVPKVQPRPERVVLQNETMKPAAESGIDVTKEVEPSSAIKKEPKEAQPAERKAASSQLISEKEGIAPKELMAPWTISEKSVEIAQKERILYLDADGKGCQKIQLQGYYKNVDRDGKGNGGLVELGNGDFPFLALVPSNGDFSLQEPHVLISTSTEYSISRMSRDGRLKVTESWSVANAGNYEIIYGVTFENLSENSMELGRFYLEAGAMPPSVAPDRKASRGESFGGATLQTLDGKMKTYALSKLSKLKEDERNQMANSPVKWTAVHSKYFLMAMWMNDGVFSGAECVAVPSVSVTEKGIPSSTGRCRIRAVLPQGNLEKGGRKSWSVTAYAGPKMFEQLASYENGLDSVMEMDRFFFWRPGWMRFISRWLLKGLVAISQWFPKSIGYGMAVILLTLLVKLIFWPLSHKSTLSMRKMQALKPQLDALKEKYKSDPQTMYRKQQELFKENNVSQLGGCLPLLLQIPVFFALFNTFRNAIEMRHASFLWAYDLSMPDTLSFSPQALPIRPLAILMAFAMYLQQKMTPNPDPQQAKMMNFMTIFFMFLFYGMPSALTLYLTVSYFLGILQTYFTNKMLPVSSLPAPAAGKKA